LCQTQLFLPSLPCCASSLTVPLRLVSSDSNVIISPYLQFVNSKFIRGFFLFLLSFYNYPIIY
jgi:hypothetical protein